MPMEGIEPILPDDGQLAQAGKTARNIGRYAEAGLRRLGGSYNPFMASAIGLVTPTEDYAPDVQQLTGREPVIGRSISNDMSIRSYGMLNRAALGVPSLLGQTLRNAFARPANDLTQRVSGAPAQNTGLRPPEEWTSGGVASVRG